MLDAASRFLYFLSHPSEFVGLWTLDLTVATVLFSFVTLLVVLKQVSRSSCFTPCLNGEVTILSRRCQAMSGGGLLGAGAWIILLE
jgi:hypothetical protein